MARPFAAVVAAVGVVACAAAMVGGQEAGAEAAVDLARAEALFRAGQYAGALEAFDRPSRSAEPAVALRARKGQVRSALRIAEFSVAHQAADALARERPDDAEAQCLLGDARWAMGLFDAADLAYARAQELSPESARASYGVARSLATRSRLPDALAAVRAALAVRPDDADLHALAGTIHERLRQFQEAAAAYDAYAALLPPGESIAMTTSRARAEFLRSFGDRTPLAMSAEDAAAAHTVPFKLVRNKVVVQGRLNGQRVEWVLDTGAERTGISLALASRARVAPVTTTLTAGVGRATLRRVQLGRADRLDIGSLQLRHVPVAIRDPAADGAPRWQGESLSPLALGLSVIVDYRKRQVTLARQLPYAGDGVALPLRMHRLPLVRGTLNSTHQAYFVVDTGGEVISISADTASALNMSPSRRIPLRVFGLSGVDASAFLLPGVDLDFDAIEYRKVGLAVLDLRAPSVLLGFQVGGIVGHTFLGDYRVTLDVARSELRLAR